jgi:thymidylate kinase
MVNRWSDIFCEAQDYCKIVGGGKNLPSPLPLSLEEEELALQTFSSLDLARRHHIQESGRPSALIDRSIHSLLAHCYALQEITDKHYYYLAQKIINVDRNFIDPDVVIYLDVPWEIAGTRNVQSVRREPVFVDYKFNILLREYFVKLKGIEKKPIYFLDSTKAIGVLADEIIGVISRDVFGGANAKN